MPSNKIALFINQELATSTRQNVTTDLHSKPLIFLISLALYHLLTFQSLIIMEKTTNSTTDIPTEPNKIYTKHPVKGTLSLSVLKNPILFTLKKAQHSLNHTESLPIIVQELCKSFVKHMQNDEKALTTEDHEEETTKTSEDTSDKFIVNTRIKGQNRLDLIFDPPKEGVKIKHKQCQKMGKLIVGLMRQEDHEGITSECKDYRYEK
jgi:hypothetical protein